VVIHCRPKHLPDLFDAFERLDRGESVALGPAPTQLHEGEYLTYPIPTSEGTPGPGAWLGFLSSGSTGRPKLVWREWRELLAGAQTNSRVSGWTWASPYRPDTFAGVQVALQAWRTEGDILSLDTNWPATWQLLVTKQPDALSCTPTFLDLLLQFEQNAPWTPRQVTLGGEVLRPAAGERFRKRFPTARFTVIYASAEHGVLLKTHRLDGWYESTFLSKRGIEWRVQAGVLEVKEQGRWASTGDQVELGGDLIRVVGRADSVANVGGVKVSLDEIGRLAEEVPGVRRAVAVSEPNSVVGQVVCLKFALEAGCEREEVQARLENHLRSHLRKEAWPRRWELDAVGLGKNSKRKQG
jgi:acyl-coenzyme A synthetase/AMP-(fatty) acid ligase